MLSYMAGHVPCVAKRPVQRSRRTAAHVAYVIRCDAAATGDAPATAPTRERRGRSRLEMGCLC